MLMLTAPTLHDAMAGDFPGWDRQDCQDSGHTVLARHDGTHSAVLEGNALTVLWSPLPGGTTALATEVYSGNGQPFAIAPEPLSRLCDAVLASTRAQWVLDDPAPEPLVQAALLGGTLIALRTTAVPVEDEAPDLMSQFMATIGASPATEPFPHIEDEPEITWADNGGDWQGGNH